MRLLFAPSLFVPAVVAAAVCLSPVANAAAQRTFVASYGLTANTAFNCSIAKPCRQFSEAIGVTISGGEIIVLDSAGYGPVTIAKSVTITAPAGIYAGISVFSGTGVTVDGTGIDVTLEGLTITGREEPTASTSFTAQRSRSSDADLEIRQRGHRPGKRQNARDQHGDQRRCQPRHCNGCQRGDRARRRRRRRQHWNIGRGRRQCRHPELIGQRCVGRDRPGNLCEHCLRRGDGDARCGFGRGLRGRRNAFSSGGASVVDVVRSRISGNILDGVVSETVPSGSALVHVTDSLISNNGGAGLLTQGVGQMTASGSTVVGNKQYGFNSSNGGMFTMQNNQVRDNSPSNVNGTVHPLSFN